MAYEDILLNSRVDNDGDDQDPWDDAGDKEAKDQDDDEVADDLTAAAADEEEEEEIM